MYNWQLKDWPEFTYHPDGLDEILLAFAEETGHMSGVLNTLPENVKWDTLVDIMVAEALKTSEIEGEYLSRKDVFSSIRNQFGLNSTAVAVKDKMAEGIGKLMVDVRQSYAEPLTKEKLFIWHEMLMAGHKGITIGNWRTHKEPMQVVSGAAGKEKVHFEAPPSSDVPKEMNRFIKWFNDTAPAGSKEIKRAVVRSAVAHIYFESIHPFEDGNGRIGRAIAEKALSQTAGRPLLLSLSKTIEANKKLYYDMLQRGQRSNEISEWINYFANTILQAQQDAREVVDFTVAKTKFFDQYKDRLNERQIKVIQKMMDAGPGGFEGGMNAAKYISITKTSKATATRDLQHLSEIGAFVLRGGGRSTRYVLEL